MCHCLLIETDAHGLVLVDTGYGLRDVAHPHGHPSRITRKWRNLLNIQVREEACAVREITALGLDPADVRHIELIHLDFDARAQLGHAGVALRRSEGEPDEPAAAAAVDRAAKRGAIGARA